MLDLFGKTVGVILGGTLIMLVLYISAKVITTAVLQARDTYNQRKGKKNGV